MEDVFRAIADPSRRALLDAMRERDGQALGELEAVLPEMTRFGVMKHLRVLQGAGLVTTLRDGRRKLHYLNPVPIRLIHDRWISRYAEPIVGRMAHLKRTLEEPAPMPELKHVYEVYIQTTPERLWRALTDPAETARYYYDATIESSWKVGEPLDLPQAGRRADDRGRAARDRAGAPLRPFVPLPWLRPSSRLGLRSRSTRWAPPAG